MTKTTRIKLAIAIGVLVFLGAAAVTAGGICYLLMLQNGTSLAAEGYQAEVQGQHDIAIERLTKALTNPLARRSRYYAHLNRGLAYARENKLEEAIADFSAAIK